MADLTQHPVFIAWKKIEPKTHVPDTISLLKKKKKKEVYRMVWESQKTRKIVAKRANSLRLKNEAIWYKEILPFCHMPSIKYYGIIPDDDDDYSWIFLDDAQIVSFDSKNVKHRLSAIKWLAMFHVSYQFDEKPESLQLKDLVYFYNLLQETPSNIRNSLTNPNLKREHIELLNEILSQCDTINSNWEKVEKISSIFNPSLIHADFHEGNIGIQKKGSTYQSIVFDWEMGAWGTPVFDLGSPIIYSASNNELAIYSNIINIQYEKLNVYKLREIVNLGRAIKVAVYIYWESLFLKTAWLKRPMNRMMQYRDFNIDVFRKLGWI